MLADSRCTEGEVPGYCPQIALNGACRYLLIYLRYITDNALQIRQNGGCLVSSTVHISRHHDT